jgi:hypothetical protein
MAPGFQELLSNSYTFGADLTAKVTTEYEAQTLAAQSAEQVKTLTAKLTVYNSNLAAVTALIQDFNSDIAAATNPTVKAQLIADRAPYLTDQSSLKSTIRALGTTISQLKSTGRPVNPNTLASIDKVSAPSPIKTILKSGLQKITYNVGSVKDAYFSGRESFMKEVSPQPGNTPVYVENAANLWAGGIANKGMIQTWSPPASTGATVNKDASKSSAMIGQTNPNPTPYGYQFQYNPTNIMMSYAGTPSVDMAYEASGQDKFNFVGTGTTQSTIGFQILINRVYDMKYYSNTGVLKPGAESVYSPAPPSYQDQQDIYNKGTMYDIEFLLRTLLGMTMPSYLRGGQTADMGFVTAIPVELHLGQSLRYLVWINQLTVNHVLFNERMVPLFTTVDVSCNRMPDFGAFSDDYNAQLATEKGATKFVGKSAVGASDLTASDADNNVWDSTGP